jgi:alkanesulfonate monooxygenase SsuD/methylene tetrahydromethanopterin reductase-like flavin-dependent oxidoreductase (luciferase family)
MKFHWFHLMPYPDLPEDFKERYRSVWVDLPRDEIFDPKRGNEIYNEYLDELEYAASAGFDGICVNEHHANAYGLMASPNLMAAALARRTERVKLVIMGNSVALYNPPIRVAEEMAMIDGISGGRVVSGFPVGSTMDTAYAYGINPATLRDRYLEAVDLIIRAWTAKEPFAFNGRYTQLRYVNAWPKPVQDPHPPVWIPGGGSIETWDMCAERDWMYNYLSYFGYEKAREGVKGYWDAVERHGKDPNPYRLGFLQFVGVADSDAEAERLYSDPALYFYNRCLHVHPGFGVAPGYSSIATIRKGVRSMSASAAAQKEFSAMTWKDIVDRGYVIAGSPDTVADRMTEVIENLNCGHVLTLLHFGNMNREAVTQNTTLFADEVIPRLRSRFEEKWSDWEDHWWPKDTLENPARPAPIAPPAPVPAS